MNGIYLTEQGKKEIEAKIKQLDAFVIDDDQFIIKAKVATNIYCLNEILASATILPVEESWKIVAVQTMISPVTESYPQGVIIQPKQ